MGHPGQMIKQGIIGQLQHPVLVGPASCTIAGVPESIGDKHAFLAVTDRTGNPAIVAVDAACQFVCQGFEITDLSPEFGQFFIFGLGARRNQLLYRLVPAGRSFTRV